MLKTTYWGAALLSLSMLAGCNDGSADGDAAAPKTEQPAPTPDPTPDPSPSPSPETPKTYSSFVLPVLPDTQFYSRYNRDIFMAQTQWVADHAQALAVPITLHLGDIVDQVNVVSQWEAADAAMKVLDNTKTPYAILAGNHDVRNSAQWDDQRTLANEPYLQWFPASRHAAQSTFGGSDDTGLNTWHTFKAQGQEFLVLALGWRPSAKTRTWANEVLRTHAELPTILITHQLISIRDGEAIDPTDDAGSGALLWDEVISPNNQVFLTLNGHYHGATHRIKKNQAGQDVLQVLVDYQMAADGGNGYMRLLELDLGRNQIHSYAYSPWLASKPAQERTYIDRLELREPPDSFTIDWNFSTRFAAINRDFKAPAPGNALYIDDARTILAADSYTLPTDPRSTASNADDYVKAQDTRAHWRFVRPQAVASGAPVPAERGVIADVSGNGNDLERQIVEITQGQTNFVTLDQVVWSDAHHPYSSAAGSICITGSRTPKVVNFLQTLEGAPVNSDTFATGYTIEALVRIDGFSEQQHRWAKILSQTSLRNSVPGWNHNEEPTGASVVLGISSLSEFQWEIVPTNTGSLSQAHLTNWSHEIASGTWQHIAIVNDGVNTDMYVEGVKVLRNATGGIGLGVQAGGKPWRIGAGTSNGLLHYGFNGCINEIRMVARPLQPSEWLTARP